ncbi:hypothetical protein CHELA1G11_13051 [Hyphomicrobiales bacterium]|nr:hypothetical protein CHELA1G2_11258 [Hyphomicrobiales bacterium]CAH1668961.1 hypothetical protein CHELA1G11_13051 [Hyphomicrobiales bacterium]
MTPHKIAELQRLREAAVARAGTTREYAIWLEALDKASGDLLTLASRALPAAPDVGEEKITRWSPACEFDGDGCPTAYMFGNNSNGDYVRYEDHLRLRDQAKRGAYADAAAIASDYGHMDGPTAKGIHEAIEALAEKKP